MPPRIVRRFIFAPLVIVITLGWIVLLPLMTLLALLTPSRHGRRRLLRLLLFSVAWLVMESATLFASLGLWVASGFGGAGKACDGSGPLAGLPASPWLLSSPSRGWVVSGSTCTTRSRASEGRC